MSARLYPRIIGMSLVLSGFLTVFGCSKSAHDDPVVRGEEIHKVCLPCHNTTLYVSPQRKIKSLPELRNEVARWGDYYNPAMSEDDINDVTAYLNAKFYNFK